MELFLIKQMVYNCQFNSFDSSCALPFYVCMFDSLESVSYNCAHGEKTSPQRPPQQHNYIWCHCKNSLQLCFIAVTLILKQIEQP